MDLGVHIIQFPSGRFGFVGTVPARLGQEVKATASDVMAGRAYKNSANELVTVKFPAFDTRAQANEHAAAHGAETH